MRLRLPLLGPGRTARQLPLVAVQVLEKVVVPLHRVGGPCALQPAGDRIAGLAAAVFAHPAEALLLERGALWLRADIAGRRGGAMRLAERMSADDERDRLLVVHRHPGERPPDHVCSSSGIWFAAGPLRVHIDQPHMIGAERSLHLSDGIAAVSFVAEPGVLGPPEDLLGLPDVWPAEAEAEGLEPHVFHGDVARVDE